MKYKDDKTFTNFSALIKRERVSHNEGYGSPLNPGPCYLCKASDLSIISKIFQTLRLSVQRPYCIYQASGVIVLIVKSKEVGKVYTIYHIPKTG